MSRWAIFSFAVFIGSCINMAACISLSAGGEYRSRLRPSIFCHNTIVRGIFDPILPLGSKRREAANGFLLAFAG